MSDLKQLMLIVAACDNSVILGLWQWTDGFALKEGVSLLLFARLWISHTCFQEISVQKYQMLSYLLEKLRLLSRKIDNTAVGDPSR
jgi:hypothetical protein